MLVRSVPNDFADNLRRLDRDMKMGDFSNPNRVFIAIEPRRLPRRSKEPCVTSTMMDEAKWTTRR